VFSCGDRAGDAGLLCKICAQAVKGHCRSLDYYWVRRHSPCERLKVYLVIARGPRSYDFGLIVRVLFLCERLKVYLIIARGPRSYDFGLIVRGLYLYELAVRAIKGLFGYRAGTALVQESELTIFCSISIFIC
jgi:hypothetical protein